MSKLDKLYRKLPFQIFVKGWGDPNIIKKIIENHKYVSKRETCKHLIKSFEIQTTKKEENERSITIEGSFISPFDSLLPGVMGENNRVAQFQLLIPKVTKTKYKPLCIHFPGTGDHSYYRRKFFLANALLKNGVASLIHTGPYYGNRKPSDQKRSSLNYMSDLFVMGGALILETHVLLKWAKNEGFDPLCVHGISMGGHMSCLGVAVYPEPVCLIPCLSWTTASHVFTEGVLSNSVNWKLLSDQYHSDERYRNEIRSAIYPSIPFHLRNTPSSTNQTMTCENVSFPEEIRVKSSFNTIDRKLHLLVHNHSAYRQYCSKNINTVQTKPSKLENMFRIFHYNKETKSNISRDEDLQHKETVEFARELLDFFTHFSNYSVPLDTRLATIIAASNDGYVPITGVSHFHDVWDSCCDIRIINGGHIYSYLHYSLIKKEFKNAIIDTLDRYVELYYNEPGPFNIKS